MKKNSKLKKCVFAALQLVMFSQEAGAQSDSTQFFPLDVLVSPAKTVQVKMSADGSKFVCFLVFGGYYGKLSVLTAENGVKSVLGDITASWICASRYGGFALARISNSGSFSFLRLNLLNNQQSDLPSYPAPTGATRVTHEWLSIDENGVATARVSWVLNNLTEQRFVSLSADLKDFKTLNFPSAGSTPFRWLTVSPDSSTVVYVPGMERWPIVAKDGIEISLGVGPLSGNFNSAVISPNMRWIAASGINDVRWDLNEVPNPEPAFKFIPDNSEHEILGLTNDGTAFGSYRSEPSVWLTNGSVLHTDTLGLGNLKNGMYQVSSIIALSDDRRVLVAKGYHKITNSSCIWVIRRVEPVDKVPTAPFLRFEIDNTALSLVGNIHLEAIGLGGVKRRSLKVTNWGEQPLSDFELNLVGTDAASFQVSKRSNQTTINAKGSLIFDVTYTATGLRGQKADLVISSASSGIAASTLHLIGGLPIPAVTVESPIGIELKGVLDFGAPLPVGGSLTREIYLRNTSNYLTVYDPSFSLSYLSGESSFEILDPMPAELPPNSVTPIRIVFNASGPGSFKSHYFLKLGIADLNKSILTFTALGPHPFSLIRSGNEIGSTFNTAVIIKPQIEAKRDYAFEFEVTNKSFMPITGLRVAGDLYGDTRVTLSKTALVHDEPLTVRVFLNQSAPRNSEYTYVVNLRCDQRPIVYPRDYFATLSVKVKSVVPTVLVPVLDVQDGNSTSMVSGSITLDYGNCPVGQDRWQEVTIRNLADQPGLDQLEISTTRLLPGFRAPFEKAFLNLSSQSFRVHFNPTAAGVVDQIMVLNTNDPNQPVYQIHLYGRGVDSEPPVFKGRIESQFVVGGRGLLIKTKMDAAMPARSSLFDGARLADISSSFIENDELGSYFSDVLNSLPRGRLTLQVSNSFGAAVSLPFYVGVILAGQEKKEVVDGQDGNLNATVFGTELSFQWFLKGSALVDNAKYRGCTGPILNIKSVGQVDESSYVCRVSMPGITGPVVTELTRELDVIELPVIEFTGTLPVGYFGQVYESPLIIKNDPTMVRVEGLPEYVGYANGSIQGTPRVLAGHQVGSAPLPITITAKNLAGTVTYKTSWSVVPPHPKPIIDLPDQLPDMTVGIFEDRVLNIQNVPTELSATGLPRGLSLSLDGLRLVGVPMAPTGIAPLKVAITASNPAGRTTKTVSLKVLPLPLAGSYQALIERNRLVDVDRALGGILNVTLTGTGTFTWSYQLAGISGRHTGSNYIVESGVTSIADRYDTPNRRNLSEILDLKLRAEGLTGILVIAGTLKTDLIVSANTRVEGIRLGAVGKQKVRPEKGKYTVSLGHQKRPTHSIWWQEGGSPRNTETISQNYNEAGVYSSLNGTSSLAQPGARAGAFTWKDEGGLLHLYGGIGLWSKTLTYNSVKSAIRADHWVFDPKSRLWSCQERLVSGNLLPRVSVPGASKKNYPGARTNGVSWTGANGDAWLYGGYFLDFALEREIVYTDTWRFDGKLKAWELVPTINRPISRTDACSWNDPSGRLWMFGGATLFPTNSSNYQVMNDMWYLDPRYRDWVNIRSSTGSTEPWPSPRSDAGFWVDPTSGDVWLFGGSSNNTILTDLWKWTNATFKWKLLDTGIATTIPGTPSLNRPPAFDSSRCWRDSSGELWMVNLVGQTWSLNPNTLVWTIRTGHQSETDSSGVVPILETASLNAPFGFGRALWEDDSGRVWTHGGYYAGDAFLSCMHSFGPADVPDAFGWLSLDVTASGHVNWAGMLGDGTPITGSGPLNFYENNSKPSQFIFRYQPPGSYMSVQGFMNFKKRINSPGDFDVAGDLTAVENLRAASVRDRSFRSGWPLHALRAEGSTYRAPVAPNLLLGLSKGSLNAQAAISDFDARSNPYVIPFTLNSSNLGLFDVGQLPVPFTNLRIVFNATNGSYTGTSRLRSQNPTISSGVAQMIERTAMIHGVVGDDNVGRGLILYPELPSLSTPFVRGTALPLSTSGVILSKP